MTRRLHFRAILFALVAAYVALYFTSPHRSKQSPASDDIAPAVIQKPALETCIGDSLHPTLASAEGIARACSNALQSSRLTTEEIALARLHRGAARMALGDRILASGDYREALKHYEVASDLDQPDALALYRRAAARAAFGQTNRALADYDEAIRIDPKYALAFYERGLLLSSRKRAYFRAISDFDRALEIQPGNTDALTRRGEARGQLRQFGPAIADLDQAVGLAPGNVEPLVLRGLIYRQFGDKARALRDFNHALALDSRNVDALISRATIFVQDGQADRAIRDLDMAVSLQPGNPLAFYNRGYLLFAERNYDLAIADYGSAIWLDRSFGLAYNNRCLARAIIGRDLVGALADCDEALTLSPTSPVVHETRGFVYLKLGDAEIARVEYDAALQIEPNRATALYGRGLAKIRTNRLAEGQADRAAARALIPDVEREFSIYGLD